MHQRRRRGPTCAAPKSFPRVRLQKKPPPKGVVFAMDTVKILRDLWRLRPVVAGVLVFAMLAGAAVVFKLPSLESRKYEVGVATARLLVDTPNSQVVEVAPKGS